MQSTKAPRQSQPPLAFTSVVCGYREAGTIIGRPGSWVARSSGGDFLGEFFTLVEARRAIQRHVEAENHERD
jgi:hypothetical protein